MTQLVVAILCRKLTYISPQLASAHSGFLECSAGVAASYMIQRQVFVTVREPVSEILNFALKVLVKGSALVGPGVFCPDINGLGVRLVFDTGTSTGRH